MMVFPYETEAANGEPMPDGLSLDGSMRILFSPDNVSRITYRIKG